MKIVHDRWRQVVLKFVSFNCKKLKFQEFRKNQEIQEIQKFFQ